MPIVTRRAALLSAVAVGVGAGAAAGTSLGVHHRVAIAPPAPPTGLTAALGAQRRLLAGYDAVIAGSPAGEVTARLAFLRTDVQAHGAALLAELENYPGWRLRGASVPDGSQSNPSVAASASVSASVSVAPAPGAAVQTLSELKQVITRNSQTLSATCLSWPSSELHAATVLPLLASIAACLSDHLGLLA